jgi:Histidine kinase-, DNA gyrase B-, and HSP90-like ATPase
MMSPPVRKPLPEGRESISTDSIRIGKDIIEILTSGMYISPVTIYREYVQNAADAIDAARTAGVISGNRHGSVSINIDHAARSVVIRDNGIGIRRKDVLPTLLGIGGSSKRGTVARGFRGVGRLSGLAYCRELVFRTKATGEEKVVSLSWDCRALRTRLAEPHFNGDLRSIVSDVVSLWYDDSSKISDHFFEVELHDISRLRSDMLLNEQLIHDYLAQVAPVPFSPEFSFGSSINQTFRTRFKSVPIDLSVDNKTVLRPYRDELTFPGTHYKLTVKDIEFQEFPDVDGQVAAVAWLAHHDYVRSIPPSLGVRGLRARVGDLQVGDPSLFDELYKEPRFNGWTLGEIHVLDQRIVPNARRDNFEVNHHYSNLIVQLAPLAAGLTQRCRTASVARNAAQIVQNVVAEISSRLKDKRSFDRAELSRLKASIMRAFTKAKRITDAVLRTQLEKKLTSLQNSLSKITPKRGASVVALEEASKLVSRLVTNREQAQKLLTQLRRLCD